MVDIIFGELTAIGVAAAILLTYLVIAPRVKGKWLALVVNPIITLAIIEIATAAVLYVISTKSLTAEPWNGGNFYTYIFIGLVYGFCFYKTRNGFTSFLTAALFMSFHEGLFFLVYYSLQPDKIALNLIGDRAYSLWMICIVFVYFYRKYPVTYILKYGAAWYMVFTWGTVFMFGVNNIDNMPLLEFISWCIVLSIFITHVYKSYESPISYAGCNFMKKLKPVPTI